MAMPSFGAFSGHQYLTQGYFIKLNAVVSDGTSDHWTTVQETAIYLLVAPLIAQQLKS